MRLCSLIGLLLIAPSYSSAQETLATFRMATSVSLAPDGRALVADSGRLYATVAGSAPTLVPTPESRPMAVEAGAGLSLLVTDPDRGTIDRIGLSGNLIRRIHVPADAEHNFSSSVSYVPDDAAIDREGAGFPGDAVLLPDGGFAAIESGADLLLIWDEAGRPRRAISSVGNVRMRPTALAVSGAYLAVLDRESGGVHLFDSFGTPVRSLQATGAVAIGGGADGLWLATSDSLLHVSHDGVPGEAISLEGARSRVRAEDAAAGRRNRDSEDLEVCDLAVGPGQVLVLMSDRLLRYRTAGSTRR